MPETPRLKIIVAVHGVGDQVLSETVQKTIHRFCRYHGETMGVPLGKIKSLSVEKDPYEQKDSTQSSSLDYQCKPFQMSELLYGGELGKLSFVEVHWADLAREMEKNGFLLEDAKSWSKTIIERLPKRYEEAENLEFGKLRLVLGEMVETIRTLGNLFKISALAGLFKFDLEPVLKSYLGDVQVVAEFEEVRVGILNRFKNIMNNLPDDLDIYIIAHSEGSVVTVLSLLQEMNKPKGQQPAWLNQVRGLMTIGSPLDKHVLLWRELLESGNPPTALTQEWQPEQEGRKIEWRNYYDNGDPIGFELEGLRCWLSRHNWTAFNFKGTEDLNECSQNDAPQSSKGSKNQPKSEATQSRYRQVREHVKKKLADPIHDFGFTRYYFPGKAHNDYWGDEHVFGHFIQTVVYQRELSESSENEKSKFLPQKVQGQKMVDYATPPKTKKRSWIVSYLAPYVGLTILMGIAVYVLHKALKDCLNEPENTITTLRNVCGVASLLAGMTVLARIPRLTSIWYHRFLTGPVCFIVGAFAYHWITYPSERSFLGRNLYVAVSTILAKIGALATKIGITIIPSLPEQPGIGATQGMLAVALGIVILSWVSEVYFPKWGLRTLIICGGMAIALILIAAVHQGQDKENKSFWPVVLATAFALYLWQLIALVFDLVFVWHHYVRHWRELGFSKWKSKQQVV